jgi:hypothetical protein
LICQKNSPLVNELIDQYLGLQDHPFALELIGLIAHVYADTFSHAGFSGVSSTRNKVDAASITPLNAAPPTATYFDKKLDSFFRMFGFQGGRWANVRRLIISSGAETASGALGHGAVATLPDNLALNHLQMIIRRRSDTCSMAVQGLNTWTAFPYCLLEKPCRISQLF